MYKSVSLPCRFSLCASKRAVISHRLLFNSFNKRSFLSTSSAHRSNATPVPSEVKAIVGHLQGILLSLSNIIRSSSSGIPFLSLSRFLSEAPKGFGHFAPTKRDNSDSSKAKKKESKKEQEQEEEEETKDDNEKDAEKEFKKKAKSEGSPFPKFDFDFKKQGGSKPQMEIDPTKVLLLISVFLGLLLILINIGQSPPAGMKITFEEFVKQYLSTKQVRKLTVVEKQYVTVTLLADPENHPSFYFNIGSVDSFERKLQDAYDSLNIDNANYIPVEYSEHSSGSTSLSGILSSAFQLCLWVLAFSFLVGGLGKGIGGGGGGKGIFSFSKAPFIIVKPGDKARVTFKDVAGLDEAKQEIMEFVHFLRDPKKFVQLGAKIPRGALLVGPPGTGKTLLAKAVAGEASVPFFSISGSDFIEMFVGVGPSRVRDLFAKAREAAPSIVFIDEIDAVGRSRSKGGWSGGTDERESTLNQLLVEMDGFKTESGVVVLAGTNRLDILDSALLRPGRFDRQIQIEKPDIKGRKDIFMVHLKKLTIAHKKADIAIRMAALTPGFSGADIANVCNEAALIAARFDKKAIELIDFEAAVDRIIGGLEKKTKVMTVQERKLVAYHEAGHAVCGWFFEHATPVLKVSILPRAKGALGFAQVLPQELNLYHKDQLLDMMCMALGGRASEQCFFSSFSTGAADDLQKVSGIARAIVTSFGMSEKIGHVAWQTEENGGVGRFTKPYSEHTSELIDSEIRSLVTNAYERAFKLVTEKKKLVEALAERLLKNETVNHDVIVEIFGSRPFQSETYEEYIKQSKSGLTKLSVAEAKLQNKVEAKKDNDEKKKRLFLKHKEEEESKDNEKEDNEDEEKEKDKKKDD
eukprot:TRINITY_DN973_c0_g1_i1.p1 TRINITY_DN973_c0_g1~~TRINITY_DN973_c0_g1_i1.p1  ORF type:complete len:890 (+),score=244.77 TRINITY_DN973_c0_g1_i1:88-2670(+)